MDYPNREHRNADKAARRRARSALNDIAQHVAYLHRQLDLDSPSLDEDSAQPLAEKTRALTGHLARLGQLRDAREWHAADQAEKEPRETKS